MLKAIIIDDEPYCSELLAEMIQVVAPQVSIMEICGNGDQGLKAIYNHHPQLVFLDVEMPKLNGFEMLEKLSSINFQLIFTTSYDQYALKAIRFSALDYLLKPIDKDELKKAIEKAETRLVLPLPAQLEMLMQKIRQPVMIVQKIALPTMEGLQMIPVETIISCASDDNYTRFKLINGKSLLATRTLKEIEEMLEHYPFLRVHRSYLVNLNEIEKYIRGDGGYLVMSDGSHVDVSQSRKEQLLQKLQPSKYQ